MPRSQRAQCIWRSGGQLSTGFDRCSSFYDRTSVGRTDTITGGLEADTLAGGSGANKFVYAAAADAGTVATGVVDVITDFKNTGVTAATDSISGFFDTHLRTGATAGYADYATALLLVATITGAGRASVIAAVGSGTSWTAYLFNDINGVTAGGVDAAIQLGTTGQFGTAALALGAIQSAQIV